MSLIKIDIVSAENSIYSGEASMVFAPAADGELGILPKHSPLLAALKPGEVCIRNDDDEEQFFFVSGGYIEIQPDHIVVLADTAVRARDLDEAKILEAKTRAEEAMSDAKSDFDVAKAKSEVAVAISQLRTVSKFKDRLQSQGIIKK